MALAGAAYSAASVGAMRAWNRLVLRPACGRRSAFAVAFPVQVLATPLRQGGGRGGGWGVPSSGGWGGGLGG